MLNYTLALFSSGYPVAEVMKRLGSQSYFSPYHKFYKRISVLINGYGYKIKSAVSSTLNKITIKPFKEFLIRLTQAISYGDDMAQFLEQELNTSLASFQAVNERKQESMNTFLALYGTLSSALVFLIVDITILAVLYSIGESLINLFTVAVVLISLMMTLVVYAVYKPYAKMIYPPHIYLISTVLIGVTAFLILFQREPFIAVFSGIVLLGLGAKLRFEEAKLERLEKDYLVFVRYFSRTFDVVKNLPESLLGVLRGELGLMKTYVKKMYNRTLLGIDKLLIFKLMSTESRSHLISMGNTVISSTIEAGGDLGFIGENLSRLLQALYNIRQRREQNGRAFETTMYTLQLTSAAVGGALVAIVGVFINLFSSIAQYSIFSLGSVNIQQVQTIILLVLIFLSYTNGFTICVAHGKPLPICIFYIGVLLLITVGGYEITLILTQRIFTTLFSPNGVLAPPS